MRTRYLLVAIVCLGAGTAMGYFLGTRGHHCELPRRKLEHLVLEGKEDEAIAAAERMVAWERSALSFLLHVVELRQPVSQRNKLAAVMALRGSGEFCLPLELAIEACANADREVRLECTEAVEVYVDQHLYGIMNVINTALTREDDELVQSKKRAILELLLFGGEVPEEVKQMDIVRFQEECLRKLKARTAKP